MNQDSTIFTLSVASGAFFIMAIIWFFTAEQHYRRAAQARAEADQHAANASAQGQRATIHQRAAEQATNRANLLAAHVSELEEDKVRLEQRVLYLSDLIRYTDCEAINRMAVMDAPLKWLPADSKGAMYTINLN